MKATDLRVGNLVNTNRAHGRGEKQIKAVEINLHYLAQIENNCNYIEPILLTEEWLLKFEFTEEIQYYSDTLSYFWLDIHNSLENSEFYIFYNTEIKCIGLHSMENEHNISKYFYNIKYVHQLQNLYFALTNNELTLNKTI